MFDILAIVFGFVLLAVLAAVPLVLLLHAAEGRRPVKDVTPHDPA